MGCPTAVAQNLEPQECRQSHQGDRRCKKSGSLVRFEFQWMKGKPLPLAQVRCSALPPWPPTSPASSLMPGSNWSYSKLRGRRCLFAYHLGVAHRCCSLRRLETIPGRCRNSWIRSGSFGGSNQPPGDCWRWTETGTRLSRASSCGCWRGWRGIILFALQRGGFLSRMEPPCDPECGLRLDEQLCGRETALEEKGCERL